MKAIGNKIIIEINREPEQTKAGLLMPSDVSKEYKAGKVVATGPGEKDAPMQVNIGDTVLVQKHAGTLVNIEEKEYTVISQLDVLVVL